MKCRFPCSEEEINDSGEEDVSDEDVEEEVGEQEVEEEEVVEEDDREHDGDEEACCSPSFCGSCCYSCSWWKTCGTS